MKKAWGKRYSVKSGSHNKGRGTHVFPNNIGMSDERRAQKEKIEAKQDKILQDTFGINRNGFNRYKMDVETAYKRIEFLSGQFDPKLLCEMRINQLAQELTDPEFWFVTLYKGTRLKVQLKWRFKSRGAADYHIVVCDLRTRVLKTSFQYSSRERATDAWFNDRVVWMECLSLPEVSD